jgi:hypothetical protein
LKEVYNHAIGEFKKSNRKLALDNANQLTANYGLQIQNLNEQLKAGQELHQKTTIEHKDF